MPVLELILYLKGHASFFYVLYQQQSVIVCPDISLYKLAS